MLDSHSVLNGHCAMLNACWPGPTLHADRPKSGGQSLTPVCVTPMFNTLKEKKSFRKLVQWVREEFEATPELRLTVREAAAFLGLDLGTAERVLSQLFRVGALRRYADNRYGAFVSV
jgi:hypothetical protein